MPLLLLVVVLKCFRAGTRPIGVERGVGICVAGVVGRVVRVEGRPLLVLVLALQLQAGVCTPERAGAMQGWAGGASSPLCLQRGWAPVGLRSLLLRSSQRCKCTNAPAAAVAAAWPLDTCHRRRGRGVAD